MPLQVKVGDQWHWVFCRKMPEGKVQATDNADLALPDADLAFFQNEFANSEFRTQPHPRFASRKEQQEAKQ